MIAALAIEVWRPPRQTERSAAETEEAKELPLLSEIHQPLRSLTHVQSRFYEKSDILAEDGS